MFQISVYPTFADEQICYDKISLQKYRKHVVI